MSEITITIKFLEQKEDNSIEAYNLEQLQEMYKPHQNQYKSAILRQAYDNLEKALNTR